MILRQHFTNHYPIRHVKIPTQDTGYAVWTRRPNVASKILNKVTEIIF